MGGGVDAFQTRLKSGLRPEAAASEGRLYGVTPGRSRRGKDALAIDADARRPEGDRIRELSGRRYRVLPAPPDAAFHRTGGLVRDRWYFAEAQ